MPQTFSVIVTPANLAAILAAPMPLFHVPGGASGRLTSAHITVVEGPSSAHTGLTFSLVYTPDYSDPNVYDGYAWIGQYPMSVCPLPELPVNEYPAPPLTGGSDFDSPWVFPSTGGLLSLIVEAFATPIDAADFSVTFQISFESE